MAFTLFRCGNEYSASVPKTVDFNFDVRPILVQKCYLCHGPDPSSREAGLRLDTFEGATALLEKGTRAIVPGHAGKSELVHRITHEDPDLRMPAIESNMELSEYEIAVLKKWIDQGAEWKPHWAFIMPDREAFQKVNNGEPVHQIDNFILNKIEEQGLKPAPQADKNALIRRVSYLLTGLPPTAEMISQFIADQSPDAYEKIVDYYLNSSAFGERWARHWMDVVRYAETKGHEFDYAIPGAWKYRDYLIRAFNEDVPYDLLVKEHLAGDMMDSIRWNKESGFNESQIGTAFYAMGEGTHSPVDIRKDEADRIDNMIDVTTKTFQALTVSCARCHDHKFDPIPTADYYAMYGVMESSRFSQRPANLTFEKVENIAEIAAVKDALKNMVADQWLKESAAVSTKVPAKRLQAQEMASEVGYEVMADFRSGDLDGWKSEGFAYGQNTTLGELIFDKKNKNLLKIADGKASSHQLAKGIYGALRSPNFTIDKNFIGIKAMGENATVRVIIDNFQLIQNPIYGELDKKINSKAWKNIKFDLSPWKGHKAYIEILPGAFKKHVYQLPANAYVDVEYVIAFEKEWPALKHSSNVDMTNVRQAIEDWANNKCSPQQVKTLNNLLNKKILSGHFPKANPLLEKKKLLVQHLVDSTFFMGISEGFGINSPVFNRGNHNDLSKEAVSRGFLSAIASENAPVVSTGSGRMELVDAILDPDNPLTSRVMVNRIWHHLFGRGIVETVDNFGLQGKLPTHPQLLDYLAIRFQEDEWSIKKMIKHIAMTKAFRRSVSAGPQARKIDPDNLWLSHFPVRRLESEAIRDGLLMVAGNFNPEMYGPPVQVHLTEFMQGRGRPGTSGPLDGDGKRSIYLEVRRNFMQPMMLIFDRPIPFSTFGKRNVTNVPAQSLILMNDPFVLQQAEIMAKDIISQNNMDIDKRLESIYIKAFGREPGQAELEQAKTFINTLAKSHDIKDDEVLGSLDVWKDYCHSIFNLKEFIYLI